MSPVSQALLQYVDGHCQSNFDTLFDLFVGDKTNAKVIEKFRSRLTYLINAGHLVASKVCGVRRYSRGNSVPLVRTPAAACQMATPFSTCVVRVQPQQYDRMHGPAYVPPADHCPRSGGLDFKRHPSRGVAC